MLASHTSQGRTGLRHLLPVAAVLLLGLALRVAPLGANRFLEDEALYAFWGLQIATGADPMLDREPVDKPPLFPYTQALSFLLLGRSETAARIPSLLASLTSIASVYGLARELSGRRGVGLLASLLLALSPFDILFASTAFTDPLMTAVTLGGLLAAARGHLVPAGALAGLAAACKQQGMLFLPLSVALALRPAQAPRPRSRSWLGFALAFAVIAGAVVGWDAARAQRPGFLAQSALSYGGIRLASTADLAERAVTWVGLAGQFWASPILNSLLVAALGIWLVGGRRIASVAQATHGDSAVAIFAILFLGLHWCVDFQLWDRYLLCLVPLVAVLGARSFAALHTALPSGRTGHILTVALCLLASGSLVGPAVRAAHSELPVGGDHGAYDGIDRLASFLAQEAPDGSVLYHHWMGHHYRFYLYAKPLRLHWYPDTDDLVRDAVEYRREPRYIAFPSWRSSDPMRAALTSQGIRLEPVYATTRRDGTVSFRLFRMAGP